MDAWLVGMWSFVINCLLLRIHVRSRERFLYPSSLPVNVEYRLLSLVLARDRQGQGPRPSLVISDCDTHVMIP